MKTEVFPIREASFATMPSFFGVLQKYKPLSLAKKKKKEKKERHFLSARRVSLAQDEAGLLCRDVKKGGVDSGHPENQAGQAPGRSRAPWFPAGTQSSLSSPWLGASKGPSKDTGPPSAGHTAPGTSPAPALEGTLQRSQVTGLSHPGAPDEGII